MPITGDEDTDKALSLVLVELYTSVNKAQQVNNMIRRQYCKVMLQSYAITGRSILDHAIL